MEALDFNLPPHVMPSGSVAVFFMFRLHFCCRWLASNGYQQQAEEALRSLRSPESVEADLLEMQQSAQSETKQKLWPLLQSPVVRAELTVGGYNADATLMYAVKVLTPVSIHCVSRKICLLISMFSNHP